MVAKFFVYGGGRWRDLDLKSGRVSGWGRVQWVRVRRGKLVVTRRRRVLTELAALAAGRPKCARDGPRLSIYREEKIIEKKQKVITDHSHCCCGHSHFRCNSEVQSSPHKIKSSNFEEISDWHRKSDAATQSDFNSHTKITTQAEVYSRPQKRKYNDLLTNERNFDKILESNNNIGNHEIVRRRSTSSSEETLMSLKTNKRVLEKELIINEDDVDVLRNCIEKEIIFPDADLLKFDSNDAYKTSIFFRLNPLVNVERSGLISKLLAENRATYQENTVTKDEFALQLGLKNVKNIKATRRYKTRNAIRSPKKKDEINNKVDVVQKQNQRESSVGSSDEPLRPKATNNSHKRKIFNDTRHKSPQIDSTSSESSSEPDTNDRRPQKRKRISDDSSSSCSSLGSSNTDKENVALGPIEKSFEAQRRKNGRFPKTDSKKRQLWLNNELPLTDQSDANHRKLRDRSIVISDSENEIENTNERRESRRLSELKKQESKEEVKKPAVVLKKRSGSPQKRVVSKAKTRLRPAAKPRREARLPYSLSEDAAIVRWVRGEAGRARQVNGNQLWRRLEECYPAIAGRERSWHSLRNRYLRNILPSLHSLPLSDGAAASLRAAAAQGEIKSRKHGSGRHPLFPAPPAGASSRRFNQPNTSPPKTRRSLRLSTPPRSAPTPPRSAPSPPKSAPLPMLKSALRSPNSSPTYAELNRRLAPRLRDSRADSSANSSVNSSLNKSVRFEDEQRPKRRLYNPK